jgi:hypothetical protein
MQLANQRVPDSSDGWIERGAMHANAAGQPVEGAADEPAVSIDQISWCCRTAGRARPVRNGNAKDLKRCFFTVHYTAK